VSASLHQQQHTARPAQTTTRPLLLLLDGNGKETEKWISENIRDIIRIRANPIRFHLKGEGNTNMVIRDIRIRIRTNPISFHPLLLLLGLLLSAGFQVEATVLLTSWKTTLTSNS